MHRHVLLVAAIVAILIGARSPVRAAPGAYHEDKRLGYKVRPPKDWTSIPIKADEQWTAAKFLSDKTFYQTDKSDGMTYEFKPEMTVIVFVAAVVKKEGAEVEETEDGGLIVEFNNPYKDYKDYLQRTFAGGGWFVEKEEKKTMNGLEVTCLEINIEKLTIPRRMVTWIFHTEDVDFAVEFEVLESSYKKLQRDIGASLRSFRTIPRTEGNLSRATTGSGKIVIEDKLTPVERKKHRMQRAAVERENAGKNLPAGWRVKKIGRFLVLDHLGDNFKHAKKVCNQLEAVWTWLDKNLGFVGEGEYVPEPIVRVCADEDEERAFLTGGGWFMGLEIVTHKDRSSGSMSFEFEYVNRRFMRMWFRYRDSDLYSAMPYWLDYGLEQVLGTARAKGRKLEFSADQWEKEGLRNAIRDGTVTRPGDLIKMPRNDFFQSQHRPKEAGALVRFLVCGAAARNRRTKTVLEDYLTGLRAVITAIAAEDEAARSEPEKAPENEEEEEARLKARSEGWKQKEARVLREAFEKAFGDWSDSEWTTFEKVYFDAIG